MEREPNLSPFLLGIAASANELSVGRTTIYALIRTGRIRAVKLGRRTLIHVDELRRFVAELVSEGTEPDADLTNDSADAAVERTHQRLDAGGEPTSDGADEAVEQAARQGADQ